MSRNVKGGGERMRKVVYVQYTAPSAYTILRSGAKVLAKRDWSIWFFGVASRGNANEIVFDAVPHTEIRTLSKPPSGSLWRLHFALFTIWCVGYLLRLRPEVVYGSNIYSAPVLWFFRRVLRGRTIYHEHDPPEPSVDDASVFKRRLRSMAVASARICIVPGEERAAEFKARYPTADVYSAWNTVDADDIEGVPEPVEPERPIVLWYHGAIVESQLPLALIGAVQRIPTIHLKFAGPSPVGQTGYLQRFLAAANASQINDRVTYLGVIPKRADLLQHMRAAHIGLCLFATPFRAPMVGASQKVFEYLSCGLALLAPNTTEWVDFVGTNGIGRVCDTAEFTDFEPVLTEMIADRDCLDTMRLRSVERVRDEWHYATSFQPIVEWMEGAPS